VTHLVSPSRILPLRQFKGHRFRGAQSFFSPQKLCFSNCRKFGFLIIILTASPLSECRSCRSRPINFLRSNSSFQAEIFNYAFLFGSFPPEPASFSYHGVEFSLARPLTQFACSTPPTISPLGSPRRTLRSATWFAFRQFFPLAVSTKLLRKKGFFSPPRFGPCNPQVGISYWSMFLLSLSLDVDCPPPNFCPSSDHALGP